MKYSVIDMGTNSIRLLRIVIEDKKIIECKKDLEVTRLGLGVNETGNLCKESMDNSINAVKNFVDVSKKEGYQMIGAFATSAVRDSENGERFARTLSREADVLVEIISGEEEACLGYLGVMAGLEDVTGDMLIVDIGGGSTELIICNKEEIKYKKSFNIGAVRQTGKYIKNDPINNKEFDLVLQDVKNALKVDINLMKEFDIKFAVGIGGTATTFGAIDLELEVYNRTLIHNHSLSIENIEKINKRFRNIDLENRKKIIGLQPKRADIITAGGIVLEEIMSELGLKKMIISDFDNLEGILVKKEVL